MAAASASPPPTSSLAAAAPPPPLSSSSPSIVNLNVGVMGHVDSGKTSLVKAISTHLSTASIDKHPQSQERGITLDLGFSAFMMPLPDRLRALPAAAGVETVQVTLVDCPGHASLVRTIIGGAHIIDLVVLIIDVTRGIQAQTVECVVVAEITTRHMIIVLNKVDLIPEAERESRVEQARQAIRRALRGSPFADSPMVAVAAAVGGEKVAAEEMASRWGGVGAECLGLNEFYDALRTTMRLPLRSAAGPLYLAVDHCFPVKGQGTVMTGTVLSGAVGVGDSVEIPVLGELRKVKSLQMFHQSVRRAAQGDRVGVCVTNLDARLIERGVLCSPGSVKRVERAVAVVRRVRAFRGAVATGSKVHVSVGHVTVMARVTFFGASELRALRREGKPLPPLVAGDANNPQQQLQHQQLAASLRGTGAAGDGEGDGEENGSAALPRCGFDWERDYVYQEAMAGREEEEDGGDDDGGKEKEKKEEESSATTTAGVAGGHEGKADEGATTPGGRRGGRPFQPQYVLLEFESAVLCPLNSLIIGSRLDGDYGGGGGGSSSSSSSHGHAAGRGRKEGTAGAGGAGGGRGGGGCRLAFYGTLLAILREEDLRRVKIYKRKCREGAVHRLGDPEKAAGGGGGGGGDGDGGPYYREATGQGLFKKETDLRPFVGMRVATADGQEGTIEAGFGRGGKFRVRFPPPGARGIRPGDKLFLHFQRYLHDPSKRMVQMHHEILRGRPVAKSGSSSSGGGGSVEVVAAAAAAATTNGTGPGGRSSGGGSGNGSASASRREEMWEEAAGAAVDPGVIHVDGVDLSALEIAGCSPSVTTASAAPAAASPCIAGDGGGVGILPSSSAESVALRHGLPAPSATATATAPPAPASTGTHGDIELRFGTVDAVRPGDLVIAKGLFRMEEDVRKFVGMRVVVSSEGEDRPEGCVVGPFGKGGKAKVQFASSFRGGVGTPLTLYLEDTGAGSGTTGPGPLGAAAAEEAGGKGDGEGEGAGKHNNTNHSGGGGSSSSNVS